MRIAGIGTEIVECARIRRMIEKHGELFLNSVFTEREISSCQARAKATEYFAAHWAAKEAVLKCLATTSAADTRWTEIELCLEKNGQIGVTLLGSMRELAAKTRIKQIQVSISHCRNYATAFAVAQAGDSGK